MGKRKIQVGMAQMLVHGGKADVNLKKAEEMIREAAQKACDIVVLPECLDTGWTHPMARELADTIPGKSSTLLCKAAKENGIYVVAGLSEKHKDRIYNAAVLISPEGEILLKHRKINELNIAHDLYSIGDSLSVAHTSLGVIGVNICADNFPNSLALAHSLARMGAQMLLSPCAWAVDADHDNEKEPYGDMWKQSYTSLTQLYDMAVVGVSNVGWMTGGVWEGRKCIGCSLAFGPGGKLLAEGPYGAEAEALIVVSLDIPSDAAKGTDVAEQLKKKGYNGI